jgi:hypothetical protein
VDLAVGVVGGLVGEEVAQEKAKVGADGAVDVGSQAFAVFPCEPRQQVLSEGQVVLFGTL